MIKQFYVVVVVAVLLGVLACQKSPENIQGPQAITKADDLKKEAANNSDLSAIFQGGGQ